MRSTADAPRGRGGHPWTRGAGREARGRRAAHPPHVLSADVRHDGRRKGRVEPGTRVQGVGTGPPSTETHARDPRSHPQRDSERGVGAGIEPARRFRGRDDAPADPQRRVSRSSCGCDVRPVNRGRRGFIVVRPLALDVMAKKPRRKRDDEDRPESFWKELARDALVAGLIVTVFLGALYLYAGVWPPLVVVESSSMQHGSEASSIGVIDTGDMVFQQAASTRGSIIT